MQMKQSEPFPDNRCNLRLPALLHARSLFVGPSSGAYVHAALEIAATGRYRTIVTVLSDAGERYGSTGIWAVDGQQGSPADTRFV
jgi:hypothetical protein